MTKKEVEKKIREIMDKDPRFRDTKLKITFKDKRTANHNSQSRKNKV